MKNKVYAFRRDKVAKMFQQALKSGRLALPAPIRPEQAGMIDDPNYCPFHRSVSHSIEDCFPFKNGLERAIKDGVFTLSPKALNNPEKKVMKEMLYTSLKGCHVPARHHLQILKVMSHILLQTSRVIRLNTVRPLQMMMKMQVDLPAGRWFHIKSQ